MTLPSRFLALWLSLGLVFPSQATALRPHAASETPATAAGLEAALGAGLEAYVQLLFDPTPLMWGDWLVQKGTENLYYVEQESDRPEGYILRRSAGGVFKPDPEAFSLEEIRRDFWGRDPRPARLSMLGTGRYLRHKETGRNYYIGQLPADGELSWPLSEVDMSSGSTGSIQQAAIQEIGQDYNLLVGRPEHPTERTVEAPFVVVAPRLIREAHDIGYEEACRIAGPYDPYVVFVTDPAGQQHQILAYSRSGAVEAGAYLMREMGRMQSPGEELSWRRFDLRVIEGDPLFYGDSGKRSIAPTGSRFAYLDPSDAAGLDGSQSGLQGGLEATADSGKGVRRTVQHQIANYLDKYLLGNTGSIQYAGYDLTLVGPTGEWTDFFRWEDTRSPAEWRNRIGKGLTKAGAKRKEVVRWRWQVDRSQTLVYQNADDGDGNPNQAILKLTIDVQLVEINPRRFEDHRYRDFGEPPIRIADPDRTNLDLERVLGQLQAIEPQSFRLMERDSDAQPKTWETATRFRVLSEAYRPPDRSTAELIRAFQDVALKKLSQPRAPERFRYDMVVSNKPERAPFDTAIDREHENPHVAIRAYPLTDKTHVSLAVFPTLRGSVKHPLWNELWHVERESSAPDAAASAQELEETIRSLTAQRNNRMLIARAGERGPVIGYLVVRLVQGENGPRSNGLAVVRHRVVAALQRPETFSLQERILLHRAVRSFIEQDRIRGEPAFVVLRESDRAAVGGYRTQYAYRPAEAAISLPAGLFSSGETPLVLVPQIRWYVANQQSAILGMEQDYVERLKGIPGVLPEGRPWSWTQLDASTGGNRNRYAMVTHEGRRITSLTIGQRVDVMDSDLYGVAILYHAVVPDKIDSDARYESGALTQEEVAGIRRIATEIQERNAEPKPPAFLIFPEGDGRALNHYRDLGYETVVLSGPHAYRFDNYDGRGVLLLREDNGNGGITAGLEAGEELSPREAREALTKQYLWGVDSPVTIRLVGFPWGMEFSDATTERTIHPQIDEQLGPILDFLDRLPSGFRVKWEPSENGTRELSLRYLREEIGNYSMRERLFKMITPGEHILPAKLDDPLIRPSKEIRVRQIIQSDFPDFETLQQEAGEFGISKDLLYDLGRISPSRGDRSGGGGVSIMAVGPGEALAGSMTYLVEINLKDRFREYTIVDLAVAPNFRASGVSRKLLQHILDFSGRLGGRVVVYIRSHDTETRRFFHELGFGEEETVQGYFEGEDAVRMILEVPASETAAGLEAGRSGARLSASGLEDLDPNILPEGRGRRPAADLPSPLTGETVEQFLRRLLMHSGRIANETGGSVNIFFPRHGVLRIHPGIEDWEVRDLMGQMIRILGEDRGWSGSDPASGRVRAVEGKTFQGEPLIALVFTAEDSTDSPEAAGLERVSAADILYGMQAAAERPGVVVLELEAIADLAARNQAAALAGITPNLLIYNELETAVQLAGMEAALVRFIGSPDTQRALAGWLEPMGIALTGERPGNRLLLQLLTGLGIPEPIAASGLEALSDALSALAPAA